MTTTGTQQQAPANGQQAKPPTAIVTFRQVLEKMRSQLELALPKHLDANRMIRIVLTTVQKTPKLLECTRESLLGCIVQSAQLGLEPDGVLGHASLVPFFNRKKNRLECQLIIGYKGLIKLARQSGEVSAISARVVREHDVFEYEYGLEERLKHVPCTDKDPGETIFAYCIFRMKDGGHQFDVMSRFEIEEIRKSANSANSDAWRDHWDEMAKKTAVRRTAKMSPASVEDKMARAIALDERADAGIPQDLDMLPPVDDGGALPEGDGAADDPEPSTLQQRKDIAKLIAKVKVAETDVAGWYDKQAVEQLTRQQAEDALARLGELDKGAA